MAELSYRPRAQPPLRHYRPLYWSTVYRGRPNRNPWDNPDFPVRWNGEDFLFYRGVENGIEEPIASVRLKNLRDGQEDTNISSSSNGLAAAMPSSLLFVRRVSTWG